MGVTRVLAVALVAALLLPAGPAMAQFLNQRGERSESEGQTLDRVAAVVNDEALTMYDIEARTRFMLLSSGLPDSLEVRRRVVPQVVRRLIDERLQLQEGRRLKISVSADEINQGIASIEQRNRMPAGAFERFLKGNGIDPATARQQVEAEIAWLKVVRRSIVPTLRIGEEEIDAKLELAKANQGRPEYLAAEIFVPVDQPENEDDVKRLMDRLIEQLRGGTPFPALAQQFSQSATAATGGDLGWVAQGMLDPDVFAALAGVEPGKVTTVRSSHGWHVLLLRDKRIAGQGDPGSVELELAQLMLPASRNANAGEIEKLRQRASELRGRATSCDAIESLAGQTGAPRSGRLGKVTARDMPEQLRAVVLGLPVGEVSAPLPVPDGVALLMVCSRKDPEPSLPSRDSVRRRLEDERAELAARRYLRDLRRAAFIELRM